MHIIEPWGNKYSVNAGNPAVNDSIGKLITNLNYKQSEITKL